MTLFLTMLTYMYGAVGILSLCSYAIIYYNEFKNPDNVNKTSAVGWIVWFLCAAVTSLYATLVVKDLLFACVSIGHMIGTAVMIQVILFRDPVEEDPSEE